VLVVISLHFLAHRGDRLVRLRLAKSKDFRSKSFADTVNLYGVCAGDERRIPCLKRNPTIADDGFNRFIIDFGGRLDVLQS